MSSSNSSDHPAPSRGLWKIILSGGALGVILGIALPFFTSAIPFIIPNPTDTKTFFDLVKFVAQAVRTVAVPFAVIVIIVTGFKFIAAGAAGKPDATTQARNTLIWVIAGTAIIVGASYLAELAVNTVRGLNP